MPYVVQAKAHFIYENLSKHDGNAKSFNASSGLLWNFTKTNKLKWDGEAASADTVAAEGTVTELQHITEKGSC